MAPVVYDTEVRMGQLIATSKYVGHHKLLARGRLIIKGSKADLTFTFSKQGTENTAVINSHSLSLIHI